MATTQMYSNGLLEIVSVRRLPSDHVDYNTPFLFPLSLYPSPDSFLYMCSSSIPFLLNLLLLIYNQFIFCQQFMSEIVVIHKKEGTTSTQTYTSLPSNNWMSCHLCSLQPAKTKPPKRLSNFPFFVLREKCNQFLFLISLPSFLLLRLRN